MTLGVAAPQRWLRAAASAEPDGPSLSRQNHVYLVSRKIWDIAQRRIPTASQFVVALMIIIPPINRHRDVAGRGEIFAPLHLLFVIGKHFSQQFSINFANDVRIAWLLSQESAVSKLLSHVALFDPQCLGRFVFCQLRSS